MRIDEASIVDIPLIADERGNLIFAEIGQCLPFQVKRFFVVFDVPTTEVRGQHAHKELHEFVVALRGSVTISVDDRRDQKSFLLNRPTQGLHIPPKTWRTLYEYSSDAVLLVLASETYNAEDYIRDYDTFLKFNFL